MQKVDIAIGVLGAVALIATGLGIALYDNINNLEDYHVAVHEDQDLTHAAEDVPDGGLEWTFNAPENAFHAEGDVTIAWTSANPSLSGNVDVTVTVTGPDGTVDEHTATFDYSDGSGEVVLDLSGWASVPEDFTGSEDDAAAHTITWEQPLKVEISITGPTGQLPVVGQDDPTYTAALDGYWHTYSVTKELPDPETA